MHGKAAGLIILLFGLSTCAFAQKNDIGFSVGAVATSNQQTVFVGILCPVNVPNCGGPFNSSTSTGVAFEGAYTRQIFNFGGASSLGLELPFVGVPGRDVNTNLLGVPFSKASQSSLFFTPSARVKFLPSRAVSPFFSIGGGLAHYGVANAGSTNRGALQFGGGLDFKTPLPHLRIRAEARDFWARGMTESSSITHASPERQHNVFAGAGIVVRF
jgi:hypothetical protein